MKELPLSRQTFSEFIEQDLLYIDKTEWVWKMVREGKYYFLSRPRRFGKSLLLSTLRSFFEGREDLFRGLYIHDKITEWKQHPVIHIDYSSISYRDSVATFHLSLLSYLKSIARQFEVDIQETVPSDFLRELIISLNKEYGKVVVLVDEYDKPLVDVLLNEKRFKENRAVLNNLYGGLKGLDKELRFVFLTGVSRFAKVGIFSGLNNPTDISLDEAFAEVVGFTHEELISNCAEYIAILSERYEVTTTATMQHIKEWYNGFSWDGIARLYNPVSVFNLFQKKIFANYWFSTGTPSFLIDIIKDQKQLPDELEGITVSDLEGGSMNYENMPLFPLLFQTGYLTIEKVVINGFDIEYQLNYPNREVRQSFFLFILAAFVKKDEFVVQPAAIQLRKALEKEDTKGFIKILTSFLADIPGRLHLPREAYYHSLFYLLMRLVGITMILEKETDKGRIDGVIEYEDKVYVIEFKFATNKRIKQIKTLTKQALKQIHTKKYYEPFLGTNKKIILFGIGFLNKQIDGKVEILK